MSVSPESAGPGESPSLLLLLLLLLLPFPLVLPRPLRAFEPAWLGPLFLPGVPLALATIREGDAGGFCRTPCFPVGGAADDAGLVPGGRSSPSPLFWVLLLVVVAVLLAAATRLRLLKSPSPSSWSVGNKQWLQLLLLFLLPSEPGLSKWESPAL